LDLNQSFWRNIGLYTTFYVKKLNATFGVKQNTNSELNILTAVFFEQLLYLLYLK